MSNDPEFHIGPPKRTVSLISAARLSFFLLIITLGWMEPFFHVGGQKLTPTDVVFPLTALLWFLAVVFGKLRLRWHNAFWILLFYFATMALSSAYSPDQRTSFVKLLGEAYLLGTAFIGYSLLESELQIRRATIAWLIGAAVAGAIGMFAIVLYYVQPDNWLLTYLTFHFGAVPVGNYPRISSVFVSASMFCNYLNVTAVLLLIAKKNGWVGRTPFWIGAFVVTVCSLFTISIGLGGIILAVGIWVWAIDYRFPRAIRRVALACGMTAAIAFLTVSFVALQPYENAPYAMRVPFVRSAIYPSPRLLVWSDTIGTFADNFWIGKGLNARTSAVVFQNTEGSTSILTDAHNTYLSVAAQNGVFSLLAMLAFCVFIVWGGVKRWDPVRIETTLVIAFVTAFVYQGLTGAFEDARHFWVLVGMLLASSRLGRGTEQGLTHSTGVSPT